jgi:hypothetical protein
MKICKILLKFCKKLGFLLIRSILGGQNRGFEGSGGSKSWFWGVRGVKIGVLGVRGAILGGGTPKVPNLGKFGQKSHFRGKINKSEKKISGGSKSLKIQSPAVSSVGVENFGQKWPKPWGVAFQNGIFDPPEGVWGVRRGSGGGPGGQIWGPGGQIHGFQGIWGYGGIWSFCLWFMDISSHGPFQGIMGGGGIPPWEGVPAPF